jgi:hypothetical protein
MLSIQRIVPSLFLAIALAALTVCCSQKPFIGEAEFYRDGVSLKFTESKYFYLFGEGLALNEYSHGRWHFGRPNELVLLNDVIESQELMCDISVTPSDSNFSVLCVIVNVPSLDFEEKHKRYIRADMVVNGRKVAEFNSENNFLVVRERIASMSFKAYYLGMPKPVNAHDTLYTRTFTFDVDEKYDNYLITLNCHYFEFFKVKMPNDTIKILSPNKVYWRRKQVTLNRLTKW